MVKAQPGERGSAFQDIDHRVVKSGAGCDSDNNLKTGRGIEEMTLKTRTEDQGRDGIRNEKPVGAV